MIPESNIGWACSGRQCALGNGDKVAFRFLSPDLPRREYTFSALHAESNRAANALLALGLAPGDTFFAFLPKSPDQFFAFLGALKACIQVGTLFSNFGGDALADRLRDAGGIAVLTRKSLLRKLLAVRERIPSLRAILVTDIDQDEGPDVLSWPRLMAIASPEFDARPTDPE